MVRDHKEELAFVLHIEEIHAEQGAVLHIWMACTVCHYAGHLSAVGQPVRLEVVRARDVVGDALHPVGPRLQSPEPSTEHRVLPDNRIDCLNKLLRFDWLSEAKEEALVGQGRLLATDIQIKLLDGR
jgi:hypothetical protein